MARLTREQSQAQTRARILEAARKVVARDGYEGATIDRIANEAGYSKGAFYSNFESKDALFFELLQQHATQDLEELEQLFSDEHDPERIIARLSLWSGQKATDRTWGLMVLELVRRARRDSTFGDHHSTLYLPQWESVGRLLMRLFPKGEGPSDPATLGGIVMELTYGVASSFTSGPHTEELVRVTLTAMHRAHHLKSSETSRPQ